MEANSKNKYNLTTRNVIGAIVSFFVIFLVVILMADHFGPDIVFGTSLKNGLAMLPFLIWIIFLRYVLKIKIRVFRNNLLGDDNETPDIKPVPLWQKIGIVIGFIVLILIVIFYV